MTELLRLKVEVIVTGGPTATRPAKEATSTIPIVMGFDNDPVGAGFVESLARPGRNVTGLSTLHPEISGKQLELLKEIIPRLSRVGVFGYWTQPGNAQAIRELKAATDALGVHSEYLEIQASKDIDAAFREATKEHVEALLVLANPIIIFQRPHFIDLATMNRLPTVYSQPEFVDAGGLFSYTASLPTCSGAPPHTSIRFSRAQSLPNFPSNNRRNLNSSSTSKPQSRSD
jgi:putative ABC transport system substrate-binding protein